MKKKSLTTEPTVRIGLIEERIELVFALKTGVSLDNHTVSEGLYRAHFSDGMIDVIGPDGKSLGARKKFLFVPPHKVSTFVIKDVTIGIAFHWQRQEDQVFSGMLELIAAQKGITLVNILPVETYLKSVISSEMSASCPVELLKAHAIISRSWLYAQREKQEVPEHTMQNSADTMVRWYATDTHTLFDLCADDHCQRYQGMGKVLENASCAIEETFGVLLTYGLEICDARYSKCCGGYTELFKNTWQPVDVPYLTGFVDNDYFPEGYSLPLSDHKNASQWIQSYPAAYCNVENQTDILKQILPSFDQETTDFYRWTITYTAQELAEIIKEKSGIDFGMIHDLIPVERGESGRIITLRIEGENKSLTVGRELEIRKWLSPQHLYSSAFIVDTERDSSGNPTNFTLRGAGWGHGVGLCQIGAAVMALKGSTYDEILSHYFPHTQLEKLY